MSYLDHIFDHTKYSIRSMKNWMNQTNINNADFEDNIITDTFYTSSAFTQSFRIQFKLKKKLKNLT